MSVLSQFFSQGSRLVHADVVAVGGGGGGSQNHGGGAGLFCYKSNVIFIAGKKYNIIIGGGGNGGSSVSSAGNDTIIESVITSYGGSQSSSLLSTFSNIPTLYTKGSLGGGPISYSSLNTGNLPEGGWNTKVMKPDEIVMYEIGGTSDNSSGGGGAFDRGYPSGSFQNTTGGPGGDGAPLSFIGYPSDYVAGGGGGGLAASPSTSIGGIGGLGGGGNGAIGPGSANNAGSPGTTGTGGGGGGGGSTFSAGIGGNGGSGTVIIRYPTEFSAATVTGNTPTPAQSGYHVYRWNGTGTITFN